MKVTITVDEGVVTVDPPLQGDDWQERFGALKSRLTHFAKLAPLDKMSCSEIQRQLLTIAKEEEIKDGPD